MAEKPIRLSVEGFAVSDLSGHVAEPWEDGKRSVPTESLDASS